MIGNEKLIEVLNDLILINDVRIEEYQKAIENSTDPESIPLFNRMISQIIQYRQELINEVKTNDRHSNLKGASKRGIIYKTWADTISSISDKIPLSAHEKHEAMEVATLKSYNEALSPEVYIPSDIISLMIMQKAKLRESFELLQGRLSMQLVNS